MVDPTGGIYRATVPTLTDGQEAQVSLTSDGRLRMATSPDSTSGGSSAYASAVTVTRPADTAAYAANDVVGASTTTTAALAFTLGPSGGGDVMITTARFRYDATAVPSGMGNFRLYFYSSTPASAYADNAAWDLGSGDRTAFQGYIDLGTPVDLGSTLYVETQDIHKQITIPSGGVVSAYLVTAGAFTPASADVMRCTIHSVAL